MSESNGCFTTPEVSARLGGVSEALIRRTIDRLGIGVRVNGIRIIFWEDLEKVEIALRGMGKLPGMRPAHKKGQAELVQEELLKWQLAEQEPTPEEPRDSINGEQPIQEEPLDSINGEVTE
jgi:hypothetical protein